MTEKDLRRNNRGKSMIIIVSGYIAICILTIFFIESITLKTAILTPITSMVTAVIGYYFGSKKQQ